MAVFTRCDWFRISTTLHISAEHFFLVMEACCHGCNAYTPKRRGWPLTDEVLFRARVFQASDALKEAICRPDKHFGPPPARAASAGRMNARSIAVFYGATHKEAALTEVTKPGALASND